jgi:short subunit dehydrogenase-like uncharacterized protein
MNKAVCMLMFFIYSGEPEFVERMQRTYQDRAVASKTTIVHCCGFDSVIKLIRVSYVLY